MAGQDAGADGPACCQDPAAPGGRQTFRSAAVRQDLGARLNRIGGQVRGIARMVDADAYCDDIIHQVSAIQAALDSVKRQLLESHLQGCLLPRIRNGEEAAIGEMLATIKALQK